MANRPPPRQLDANQVRLLEQQGFTNGLIQAVSHYVNTIPLRLWVIDNSQTMQVRDGHRIAGSTFQTLTTTNCTRWEEAQDEIAFTAYMSGCLGVPTRFNMVNAPISTTGVQLPNCFSVAEKGPAAVQQDLQTARQIMGQIQPSGPATPLAFHIRQIRELVVQMAPQLAREGKSVSVILATSGVPTDANGFHGPAVVQDFVQALQSLQGLPLYVVVRLCTDDERVVDFYNTLDAMATYDDVVDDFFGEAMEVYLKNPWLNYALPLHRFRQMGFRIPVLDKIDEQLLSYAELRQFCAFLFPMQQPWPDPATNWPMFLRAVSAVMAREKMHFNPIKKGLGPWIDLPRLHLLYGRNMPFPHDMHVPVAPQAQQPPPPPPPRRDLNVPVNKYAAQGPGDEGMTQIKRGIILWATAAPSHQQLRSIGQLLSALPETFPPAFGISDHAYFKKFKPFTGDALADQDEAVLKRAMRKTKFFLHPDKLPKDLTKEQSFLCKMLWDIVADAWQAFNDS